MIQLRPSVVAFVKSFRTVDPINQTGAWLNPDIHGDTLWNKRTLTLAVVENQDGCYDSR